MSKKLLIFVLEVQKQGLESNECSVPKIAHFPPVFTWNSSKIYISHSEFIIRAEDTAHVTANPAARLSEISLIFAATNLKQIAKRNVFCWQANLLINCNP